MPLVMLSRANKGAVDPYFDNVVLLISGRNDIIDNTGRHTLSLHPNVVLSTEKAKWGSRSINCGLNAVADVSGILVPSSSDFAFGTGDLTIEMWMNHSTTKTGNASSSYIRLATNASASPSALAMMYGNSVYNYRLLGLAGRNTGAPDQFISSTVASNSYLNVWNHYALTRKGSTCYLFINGQLTATKTAWSYDILQSGFGFIQNVNCFVQDIRVTKGVCRYDANFQIPTEPFPTI